MPRCFNGVGEVTLSLSKGAAIPQAGNIDSTLSIK